MSVETRPGTPHSLTVTAYFNYFIFFKRFAKINVLTLAGPPSQSGEFHPPNGKGQIHQ